MLNRANSLLSKGSKLCILLLISSSLAQAQTALDQEAWGRLLTTMKTHFGYSDDSRWIHLLPIARSVKWADASGEEDLWETGDIIPIHSLLYTKGDARFSLNWEQFLYTVDLGNKKAPNPARDKAEKAWIAAVKARNKLESDLVNGYENSQKGKPAKFKDPWYAWYNENAGPQLAVANKKVADALQDYAQYLDPKDPIIFAYNTVISYLSVAS